MLQVAMSFRRNPFEWGMTSTSSVTSQSVLIYIADVSHNEIARSGLNASQAVSLTMGDADETGQFRKWLCIGS